MMSVIGMFRQSYNFKVMAGTLAGFAAKHWIAGGIATSLLWFLAGKESSHGIGPVWRGVGVVILATLCGWCIAEREWLGLAAGIGVLYWEIHYIRRLRSRAPSQ
jgi:hypothetical protein